MVGPERRQRVEPHAFRGVLVVGGVVVDDRLCDRNGGQGCYGDHRGGWHHGVEDERQAVGHVAVGRAGQRGGVTCGAEGAGERADGPALPRPFSPFSSTASTLASFPNSSWTTTVRPRRAATCRGLQRGRDSDNRLYALPQTCSFLRRSGPHVCRAALVQLMRFLSLIFSRINKAHVSWP